MGARTSFSLFEILILKYCSGYIKLPGLSSNRPHGPRKLVRINIYQFSWWWVRSCDHMIKSSILLSLQLNTAVESRQKRYRASQQLGRSDSLDKLQMKKMASDILNWTMEEMQLLMHGVFQVNWPLANNQKVFSPYSISALFYKQVSRTDKLIS